MFIVSTGDGKLLVQAKNDDDRIKWMKTLCSFGVTDLKSYVVRTPYATLRALPSMLIACCYVPLGKLEWTRRNSTVRKRGGAAEKGDRSCEEGT